MSEKIVQLNEEIIKWQLKELVRGSIVGDKCMGMLEAVGEVFPDAKYQRCTVHFYRNVFSVVPANSSQTARPFRRNGALIPMQTA